MRIKVEFWGYDNNTLPVPKTEEFYAILAEKGIILHKGDQIIILDEDVKNLSKEQYDYCKNDRDVCPESGSMVDRTLIFKSEEKKYDVVIVYDIYYPFFREKRDKKDKKELQIYKIEKKIIELKKKLS